MFKPRNEEPLGKEIETVIGPSVQVEGNFTSKGNIIVEGGLKGSLKTDKNVKVGEGAHINASVMAQNAIVAGEIRGNIKIKGALEIKRTARVLGDIETKMLSVENGALLNGKCTMIHEEMEVAQKEETNNKKK